LKNIEELNTILLNQSDHINMLQTKLETMVKKSLQKQMEQQKTDIVYELPLHLSRLICNEWIDVYDICNIDTAYGCKIKRQKIVQMFNNLLIFGLNENYVLLKNKRFFNDKNLNINLYIKWLIKNNIQVQYFSDSNLDFTKFNWNEHEIYKILCKLNHFSLITSESIYSNNNLFQLLKNNQFNDLKILDLICDNEIFINSTELKSIIENNLNIQELILGYNENIDDDCSMFIIENCEHLKFLSLDGCKNLSDLCFTKLTKQNKNLIKLNIDECCNFTNLSLNMISTIFLNLQELSFQLNDKITDQGLIEFANNCSALLKLSIQDCEKITNIGIIEITKVLKNLNSFHFGKYFNDNITDESLIAISKNCLNLKVLNLWYSSPNITNICYNALSTTILKNLLLKNLTELYFGYCCRSLKDSNIIEISKYFLNLQAFSIYNNKNITDESIIAITRNCKNLTELCILCCKNITNIGFESIVNCLKLKYLTIKRNKNITESCLIKIIKNSFILKELKIYNCENISDEYFIEYLKKQNLFVNIHIK
jgi:hypothetical protein